jgi:FixJ family two-component response regulator
LHKVKAPVVLYDRDLPGKGWRGTVEDLASSPHRACIILVSGVADAYLWNEVVRTGGFDVLSKPLREDEVVRAVRLASSYWNNAKYREIGRTRNNGRSGGLSGDRGIGRPGEQRAMVGAPGDREIG